MKYLSLLVFCALLIWSWRQAHSVSGISYETHFSIQEKMAETIISLIQEKRGTARDISISRIWTTPLDEKQVEVSFTYKFTEDSADGESTEMSVTGKAILELTDETPDQELWTITDVMTDRDTLVFSQGITIRPGVEDESPTLEQLPSEPADSPSTSESDSASEK